MLYDSYGGGSTKFYEIEDEDTGELKEICADAEFSEEGNLQYVTLDGDIMEEITREDFQLWTYCY